MAAKSTGPVAVRRYGTAGEIAAHISDKLFTVSERTVRRDWRARYGLAFVVVNGRSMAPFDAAEKIAQAILDSAPPAPAEFRKPKPAGGSAKAAKAAAAGRSA